ncbi:ATP-dependent DNA ligase [Streptomyces sp. NPDC090306]|uniref:ATP-dependent DNA ligase n=1 Tax=Streptomyces sp. NPDC090306 TaxID=3365961 RepID=UPI003812857D
MLTESVNSSALPAGWAAEPKWDGFRALVSVDAGGVVLRSRRGTEMGPGFPEVVAAAAQLSDATALDGELVVWDAAGRLAFERLQGRLHRRGAGALRAAAEWPAHFVVFDVLRLAGTDTTGWPYRRRRAALERVFAARRLTGPWTLCPSTTNPATVQEWLTWSSVGMEGLVFKRLDGVYRPGVRGWQKYKARETTEAIVGAVTGSSVLPQTLLLGRYDRAGRLRYVGRTTVLPRADGARVGERLSAAAGGHPWEGWSFSAGWGRRETLAVTLVEPEVVAEVGVDVARDASGRWRHPARWHRLRADLGRDDVPRVGASDATPEP